MIDSQVMAFIPVAAILTVTPGADTMLVVRNALARGKGAGAVTTLGICSGVFVHALVSALGLSVILLKSSLAFAVVKYLGAAYIVYLGVRALIGKTDHDAPAAGRGDPEEMPDRYPGAGGGAVRRSLMEGFLCNVLNPKVAVFYLALLPQFISPGDRVVAKSVLLASIHFAMGIVWLLALSLFLDKMRPFISGDTLKRRLEKLSGAIFIFLGIRMALEHK